jgi:twitching motility protein PilT
MARLDSYFKKLLEVDGSDLHMTSGVPPKMRIHGKLTALKEEAMSADRMAEMLDEIFDDRQRRIFNETHDLDMAYELVGVARFRVSCFQTRLGPAGVFRLIPEKIMRLAQLGVPETILRYTKLRSGLVLVTGPTGSGKSTTLAAVIDHINEHQKRHIITIEEPIEFVHPNKNSYITQREVGVDCESFASALKAASREDGDIILVGELRDLETISQAVTAAEMGNLVFATLHTNSAAKTIDRIIDVFPEDRQNQIRIMLSVTLKGICAQLLMPRVGTGRVPVNEILFGSFSLGNIIREGSIGKIVSLIEAGRGDGMCLMDDALMARVKEKSITPDTAYLFAEHKQRFEGFLSGQKRA